MSLLKYKDRSSHCVLRGTLLVSEILGRVVTDLLQYGSEGVDENMGTKLQYFHSQGHVNCVDVQSQMFLFRQHLSSVQMLQQL